MAVLEDTKQQIIERLNDVPADKLRSVLEYVAFVAMDLCRAVYLPVASTKSHFEGKREHSLRRLRINPVRGFRTSKSDANSDCENAGVDASGAK